MAPAFSRIHDKKVAILGLSAAIGLPQEMLPASLRGVMTQIVQFTLKFLFLIGEQKKAVDLEPSSSSDDDEPRSLAPYGDGEGDDEDDGPIPDDQDVDADISTVTRLAHEAAEYSYDYNEVDEDELVDEAIYTSPIDNVDEVVFFVHNFKAFAERDMQTYLAVLSGLSGEEKQFVTALVQLAHEKASGT